MDNNAKIILEDGTIFTGSSFGYEQSVSGEVVFCTGMVGYPETLTDPSYKGQILVLTYPLVGNYGVPATENGYFTHFESDKIHVTALIVSDYSQNYGHWNASESLSSWLIKNEIPGISGIDTRQLTKIIREKGTMLGKIVFDEKDIPFYDPNQNNLVAEVSCKKNELFYSENSEATVVLVDCGAKNNIIRSLNKRGLSVIKVPWDEDFTKIKCDGIMLSNGPGDPQQCKKTIEHIKKALQMDRPIFGICLGNQLLSLAAGGNTYKLKYGHRSQNQPCVEVGTKRCYITSQNHGFAVAENSLSSDWEVWFTNLNDGTNEGIRHKKKPFCSVQFHPEAAAGPTDSEFLFDRFKKVVLEYAK